MAAITSPKHLNKRRERSYPRVVKRARHNSYRVKKPGQHGTRHDTPATIKLINPVLTRGKQASQHYLMPHQATLASDQGAEDLRYGLVITCFGLTV